MTMTSKTSSSLLVLIGVLIAVAVTGLWLLFGRQGLDNVETSIRPVAPEQPVVPAVGLGERP